ncbi:hypothetical protein D3C73_1204000 [compost metagenome]
MQYFDPFLLILLKLDAKRNRVLLNTEGITDSRSIRSGKHGADHQVHIGIGFLERGLVCSSWEVMIPESCIDITDSAIRDVLLQLGCILCDELGI